MTEVSEFDDCDPVSFYIISFNSKFSPSLTAYYDLKTIIENQLKLRKIDVVLKRCMFND